MTQETNNKIRKGGQKERRKQGGKEGRNEGQTKHIKKRERTIVDKKRGNYIKTYQ